MAEDQAACPKCGAVRVGGLGCWEQLGALLAWEFDDPELRAEHFLTVATWNLQHPSKFTDAALSWLSAAFIEHLDHGSAVADLRRAAVGRFEGKARVRSAAPDGAPVLRRWSMTIAHVYLPDQPAGAADRVRAWARAVRRELG